MPRHQACKAVGLRFCKKISTPAGSIFSQKPCMPATRLLKNAHKIYSYAKTSITQFSQVAHPVWRVPIHRPGAPAAGAGFSLCL